MEQTSTSGSVSRLACERSVSSAHGDSPVGGEAASAASRACCPTDCSRENIEERSSLSASCAAVRRRRRTKLRASIRASCASASARLSAQPSENARSSGLSGPTAGSNRPGGSLASTSRLLRSSSVTERAAAATVSARRSTASERPCNIISVVRRASCDLDSPRKSDLSDATSRSIEEGARLACVASAPCSCRTCERSEARWTSRSPIPGPWLSNSARRASTGAEAMLWERQQGLWVILILDAGFVSIQ